MSSNKNHEDLWLKIKSFQIDEATATFNFTQRLAKENGWSMEFSRRVVDEYKKFIYLICITDQMLTPSASVDQAWHLHLIYSNSYWVDLCKNTLNREIHHRPTTGKDEKNKFAGYYNRTVQFYLDVFEQKPPKDIWPIAGKRFKSTKFRRVDVNRFWMLKKLSSYIKRIWSASALICLCFVLMSAWSVGGVLEVILRMIVATAGVILIPAVAFYLIAKTFKLIFWLLGVNRGADQPNDETPFSWDFWKVNLGDHDDISSSDCSSCGGCGG